MTSTFEMAMSHCKFIVDSVLPHTWDIHLNKEDTLLLFGCLHNNFLKVNSHKWRKPNPDIAPLCVTITDIISHVRSSVAPNDSIFAIVLEKAMKAFGYLKKNGRSRGHIWIKNPYVEDTLIKPVNILEKNLLKQVRHLIYETPSTANLYGLIAYCSGSFNIELLTIENRLQLESVIHLICLVGKDDSKFLSYCLRNVPHNKLQKFINLQRKIDGNTGLHLASKNGKKKIVICLLQHGANTSLTNYHHQTALDLASNAEIANLIKQSNFFDSSAEANSDFLATLLAESKLNNKENKENVLPDDFDLLNSAIDCADVALVQEILNQTKSCVLNENKFQEPFLFKAIAYDNLEIVRLLLEKGADPSALNCGMNALHFAVRKGDVRIVDLLLDYIDDVNVRTQNTGQTALHMASENGHVSIVKLLLAQGANFESKNGLLKTPLDVSINRNVSNVLKAIVDLHEMVNRAKLSVKSQLNDILSEVKRSDDYDVFFKATNDNGKTIIQILKECKGPLYFRLKKLFLKAPEPPVSEV